MIRHAQTHYYTTLAYVPCKLCYVKGHNRANKYNLKFLRI